VEVTKFTEVGYVGRDVESMIRDLTELAINMIKAEEKQKVMSKAREIAEERLLDLLLPPKTEPPKLEEPSGQDKILEVVRKSSPEPLSTREKLRTLFQEGKLEERYVDMEVTQRSVPMVEIFSSVGM
jgi:ATP-dependent HslUV protease ATP-binding subunit HslU